LPINSHRWGSLTLFNGLPSDTVRAIAQTTDGLLWFGTDSGLAHFDGRRVQTVAFPDAAARRVTSLRSNPDGMLFVGTNLGAYFRSEDTLKLIAGTEGIEITAIKNEGDLHLATSDGKLLKAVYITDGSMRTQLTSTTGRMGQDGEPVPFTSLFENNGQIFAGTGGSGVLKLHDGTMDGVTHDSKPYFINALARASGEDVWIGARTGLYRLSASGKAEVMNEVRGDVSSISGNDNNLWAATNGNGLFHIIDDKAAAHFTFENTSGSLRSNTIWSVFSDSEGVIWIGTDRGVSRFDPSSPFNQALSDNANSNFVRTVYFSKSGRQLAGTNRGIFERIAGTWSEVNRFPKVPVYRIAETLQGTIVAGTPNGLLDIDGKLLLAGDVRGNAAIGSQEFAAVFGAGIFDLNKKDAPAVFQHSEITEIETAGGLILFGTVKDGIYSFDGRAAIPIAGSDGAAMGAVRKIVVDETGAIFVASEKGLFKLKDGSREAIIQDTAVRDVNVANGEIWAATFQHGLFHARPHPLFGLITANVGTEEGLPSEKCFALLKNGESYIVGTSRGISEFTPSPAPAGIKISRVASRRLHDASEFGTVIPLEYPQNSILIEVLGINSRTFPEEFQYGFLLYDSDDKVLDKKISSDALYSPAELSPGTYRIEARAFGRGLNASRTAIITFRIAGTPFPWTATALGALLAVALVALVWAIQERRQIALRNQELAAARLDLANEAERERRRIARDLHDQSLADLRDLMMKSDRLKLFEGGFREDIESISTEIRRICEDLSPSVLENVGLLASLEFLIGRTVDAHTFMAEEGIEENLTLSLNSQLQVYRICQEVLTNIKRHANAALVEMSVTLPRAGLLRVEVINDGKQFVPAGMAKKDGRGINGIRGRAAMIKAVAEWNTEKNGRTRFVLEVPA